MDISELEYQDAREQIKDGQIIFYRGYNWFHKIVNWATSGDFTHCGIAIWMTDSYGRRKLMCVESSVGGARLVTVRSYAYRGMTVIDVGLDWDKYGDSPIEQTGTLHYNYINFALLGVKGILLKARLLYLATKIKPEHGKVCSEFVANYLMEAGLLDEQFVSPNQLYAIILGHKAYKASLHIAPQKIIV